MIFERTKIIVCLASIVTFAHGQEVPATGTVYEGVSVPGPIEIMKTTRFQVEQIYGSDFFCQSCSAGDRCVCHYNTDNGQVDIRFSNAWETEATPEDAVTSVTWWSYLGWETSQGISLSDLQEACSNKSAVCETDMIVAAYPNASITNTVDSIGPDLTVRDDTLGIELSLQNRGRYGQFFETVTGYVFLPNGSDAPEPTTLEEECTPCPQVNVRQSCQRCREFCRFRPFRIFSSRCVAREG
eukprot:CAMPEP_0118685986 /NCGR_PEP_ID=MMETSP0800-20121206/7557_1 /TAXON_ID=210618 ORGANISM="Striatella unipunctata, Strain CCMP2910" /NCGR_SAMPLE_ID=MMETSP0800 /ASSEMBLY_ACC=CAM_ASM_000638 /LENGTH=240 /DNA_ID=CAMNT_0006582971 /DNA_START=177 /DNA_END=899 /DNA_ORIENTATION=-